MNPKNRNADPKKLERDRGVTIEPGVGDRTFGFPRPPKSSSVRPMRRWGPGPPTLRPSSDSAVGR